MYYTIPNSNKEDHKTSDNQLSTIGKRLKFLRRKFDLSQEEFAKKIEFPRQNLSKAENDNPKQGLTKDAIRNIILHFDVNYEWLIEGTGEPFKSKEIVKTYNDSKSIVEEEIFKELNLSKNIDELELIEKQIDALHKIGDMKDDGKLTEEEFIKIKNKLVRLILRQ